MGNLERITANNSAIQECIDIANGLSGGSGGSTIETSVISFNNNVDTSSSNIGYILNVWYVDTIGTTHMQSITYNNLDVVPSVEVPENYLVFIRDSQQLVDVSLTSGGEPIYQTDYMLVFSPTNSNVVINITATSSSGSDGPGSGASPF